MKKARERVVTFHDVWGRHRRAECKHLWQQARWRNPSCTIILCRSVTALTLGSSSGTTNNPNRIDMRYHVISARSPSVSDVVKIATRSTSDSSLFLHNSVLTKMNLCIVWCSADLMNIYDLVAAEAERRDTNEWQIHNFTFQKFHLKQDVIIK